MAVRLLTVVGARPQFIKAMPVCRALKAAGIEEYLVHTGQHYDAAMSDVFFAELNLPAPSVHLGIGSSSHGQQTGRMLIALEEAMQTQRPDCVLVYGDTNSTLAGALAAAKLRIPLAHVEAGLRSFNREMPEEINRVLTDHCSTLLFCPTRTAVDNLGREGIEKGVHLVGDTMLDAVRLIRPIAEAKAQRFGQLGLAPQGYYLLTLHRPYNVDDPAKLRAILDAMAGLSQPVIFPVHPRTRAVLCGFAPPKPSALRLIDPVGYLDMLKLEANALAILTDSGGVQKEAHMLAVPCLTIRPETEWVETLEGGWNRLVPAEPEAILNAIHLLRLPQGRPPAAFGDGKASETVVSLLAGLRAPQN
ncbi:MAG: UDP-N-acetylglucosamine 2-epimerase (non-hydrolyzing) [Alphaproteobacteria bacterium]|nr:UDP-N-acetylglucosamine 2-epimerase (non-hydrolyzing) [Alphaproteobacteria bacterium]